MRLILRLLIAQFHRHWLRTLLAFSSLVTSVAMVVVFVGGQDVTLAQSQIAAGRAAQALGRFDLIVFSASSQDIQAAQMRSGAQPPRPEMTQAVLDWLRSHRDVEALVECCEASVPASRIEPTPTTAFRPGMGMGMPLIATACSESPFPMERGAWVNQAGEGDVVVDYSMAARLAPPTQTQPSGAAGPPQPPPGFGNPLAAAPEPPANTLGARFQITTPQGRRDVRIRGVIKPPVQNRMLAAMYVSPATFERLIGQPAKTNRILIDLKNGVPEDRFVQELANFAKKAQQPIHIQTNGDFQAEAGRMASMPQRSNAGFFPLLRNAGINLAILAAMFVIFSTLNIGLQERSRQLAMLRAIGMTRKQVVGLITAEVFILALAGYLVGLAAGVVVMRCSVAQISQMAGQELSLHMGLWAGLGALTAFGAAFAAAILPAIFASRRKPLEGMASSPFLQSKAFPMWLAPIGLVLIAANPVVSMTVLVPESWRTTVALPISCLAAITGFALLMPLAVLLCERVFGFVAGLLFGLNHRLLEKQLSASLWRTVGCTTALMVGLGLYITVQIWGQSMLRPFVLTSRSPDAIVTILPDGIGESGLAAVSRLEGVQNVVPMIMQHPDLADLPAHVMGADEVIKGVFSRTVIYLGCDVNALLDERTGMIGASFLRGSPQEAYAQLAQGDSCLVTDGFYLRAPEKYDVGQTIEMDSMGGATPRLKYRIAGVVEMPGWQWLTKFSQMRKLGRVGGLVIVPVDTAKAAYPGAKYRNFWFKLEPDKTASMLELPMVRIADPDAKLMMPASRPTIESASGSRPAEGPSGGVAGRPGGAPGDTGSGMTGRPGGRGGRPGMGGPRPPMIDSTSYASITDTRQMTAMLLNRAGGIIESLTLYPLLALGLSALAVVGTMMTSVRVRNWEIGILRSIGLTRGQLLRLILAEGLLIGLLATVASLIFGLLVSWTGIASSREFWGVHATFVIPWGLLLVGIAATVVLCLAGSVWPAIMAARRDPLRLLQDGRTMN